MSEIGERIRLRRLARGWSVRFVASRAGLHSSTLSRIERGLRGIGSLTILERLAVSLECSAEDLIGHRVGRPFASGVSAKDIDDLRARLVGIADGSAVRFVPGSSIEERAWDGIRQARVLRHRGDYSSCIKALHMIIAGLGRAPIDMWRVAHVCVEATYALSGAGFDADGWIAARAAMLAARRSGDPCTRATALVAACRLATDIGDSDYGVRLAHEGLLLLADARNDDQGEPTHGCRLDALRGMLHLGLAFAMARGADPGPGRSAREAVRDNLAIADNIAARMSEPHLCEPGFGRPVVVAWQVLCDVTMGRLDDARRHGTSIQPEELPSVECRARFLIDLARAWSKDPSTVAVAGAYLRRAEILAPQVVLGSVSARICVRDVLLVARDGKIPTAVRALAGRLGLT